MKTNEAVKYFGTKAKIAQALGISPAAVTLWGKTPPAMRQMQLQQITDKELLADPGVIWTFKTKRGNDES